MTNTHHWRLLLEGEIVKDMESGDILRVAKAGLLVSELNHSLKNRRPLPGFGVWNGAKLRNRLHRITSAGGQPPLSVRQVQLMIRRTLNRCLEEYQLFDIR
jgi:hypothetical protein